MSSRRNVAVGPMVLQASSPSPESERAADLAKLEADVAKVLDEAGGAKAAEGRLLARLTSGTATENASVLRDVLSAAQRHLVRAIYGAGKAA
jgi:hypothetical protein